MDLTLFWSITEGRTRKKGSEFKVLTLENENFNPFQRLCNIPYSKENPQGVLLGILGGGVPPSSPNPGPISNQRMSFSTPVFRPGL